MYKRATVFRVPFSPFRALVGSVLFLVVAYMVLLALVMSSATLTILFTQSIRTNEASVASLEAAYLQSIAAVTQTDFVEAGYAKPITEVFVTRTSGTARR